MNRRIKRPSASLVVASIALFGVFAGNGYATVTNLLLNTTNTGTARTTLSAPIADKALQLTNTSTGTGATALGLSVASGHAPFTTSSTTKVVGLNADLLDGFSSSVFGRVTSSDRVDVVPTFLNPYGTEVAVSINVPKTGFVLLQGSAVADSESATCQPCYAGVRFRNENNGAASIASFASVTSNGIVGDSAVMTDSYVWPVTPGLYTFALEGTINYASASTGILNPTMTALFVPFSGTGSSTAPPPAAATRAGARTINTASAR